MHSKIEFNPFVPNVPFLYPLKQLGLNKKEGGLWSEKAGYNYSVSGQSSRFAPPENTSKPKIFWCYQGI